MLAGLFVFEVIQLGWAGALVVNTKLLPELPWNVPVGLLYLWFVCRYFNGRGWPASTSASRRSSMRARALSRGEWQWSLVYSVLCVVFLASIINVVYRFIAVPEGGQMDLSMFPWWTLYPSLIMLSINAGVSEEVGFRGYMQGPLERRYGPVPAILFTSLLFWVAHFNHASGPSRWALIIAYGIALGAVTWAVDSIRPAILAHALADAVSFTTVAGDFGPEWFMKKPALFAETGVDTPFVVFSLLLAGSVASGVLILRRLRRLRDSV